MTATANSPSAAAVPTVSRRRGIPGWKRLGWLGRISAATILLAVIVAVFGPLLAPFPPNQSDLAYAFVEGSLTHPLGFDSQGRDLLSRLLVGARSSMLGAFIVVVLAMAAGTILAMVAAWRRGWVDNLISSGSDLAFAFPGLLLAVLTAAVLGPSQLSAAASLAVAYIPYVARIVRGAALRERSLAYIEALEVQGSAAWSINVRHVLPNIAPMLIAQGTILFGWAALDLAAISFIGLGVQPPQADWGVMAAEGESGVLQGYPAESLTAGAALVLVVVAFNVLGERLNDQQAKELS